jgi:hypothetical protein
MTDVARVADVLDRAAREANLVVGDAGKRGHRRSRGFGEW